MSKKAYFSAHDYYDIESPARPVLSIPVQIGVDTLPEGL